jgi:hypothetical protein
MNEKKISYVKIFYPPREGWEKHTDGGDYASSVTYSRNAPGELFEASYWCSGSLAFDWCDVYGAFQSCESCREYDAEERRCLADPVLVTESEVLEALENLGERDEIDDIEYF